jgi:hypothetical protein
LTAENKANVSNEVLPGVINFIPNFVWQNFSVICPKMHVLLCFGGPESLTWVVFDAPMFSSLEIVVLHHNPPEASLFLKLTLYFYAIM